MLEDKKIQIQRYLTDISLSRYSKLQRLNRSLGQSSHDSNLSYNSKPMTDGGWFCLVLVSNNCGLTRDSTALHLSILTPLTANSYVTWIQSLPPSLHSCSTECLFYSISQTKSLHACTLQVVRDARIVTTTPSIHYMFWNSSAGSCSTSLFSSEILLIEF